MSDFLFNFFSIIGGFLLAIWGVLCAIKKHRKTSWWFLVSSILCFAIALIISYNNSRKEKIEPINNTKTTNDSLGNVENKISKPKYKPKPHSDIPKQIIPDLPVEQVNYTIKPISSPNPELPFAIEAILQTNIDIESPHFIVQCDGIIGDGEFHYPGMNVYEFVGWTINNNSFDFFCARPDFTPKKPIVITLFSKTKINVLSIKRLPSL